MTSRETDLVSLGLSLLCAVLSCSVMLDSATLWTAACQAPLSMEFFRQDYRSGLPCPSPRDLPEPEIEPMSLASRLLAGVVFTAESPGNPRVILVIAFSLIFTFGQFHLSSPCKNKLTP